METIRKFTECFGIFPFTDAVDLRKFLTVYKIKYVKSPQKARPNL